MKSRKVQPHHILDVALALLKERPRTNPLVLDGLAKIAAEYKGRERVFDACQERERVKQQRKLFAALPTLGPDGVAAEALKQAMIDRAWRLLDEGEVTACDVLLEFVPEEEADKMLHEYFPDDDK